MYTFFMALRIFLFIAIPAFFAYLSTENNVLDILQKRDIIGSNVDLQSVKQFFLVCSVLLSNGILVWLYEYNRKKNNDITVKNHSLLKDLKISFLSSLASELENQNVMSIKFRVWREKKGFTQQLEKLLGIDNPIKDFELINTEGLSDFDTTNGLSFRVSPDWEGLVGKCYNEKVILYEEDVSGLDEMYHLNNYQISKTRNSRFCVGFPIFNKYSQVVSIISMDSIYSIRIPDESNQRIADMIMNFTQDLSKYYPKLFK